MFTYEEVKKKKSTEEHEEVKKMVFVKWIKPPLGWFKLNIDGSSIQHRGFAGGGGIILYAFGNWVIGSKFDFTSSIMAELSALWHGLVMAKNIGVAKIVVELDPKVAVNLITNMSKTKKSMKSFVMEMECKNLLQNFEKYIVQFN